jgi:riboflavin synthase
MFTGLVEEVGVVRRLERRGEGGRLAVTARKVLEGTRIGDSIAVDGACLTVVEVGGQGFTVDCMPETLSHTTLGEAAPGRRVNLERSLMWGDRIGGHLVLGHVDGTGEVLAVVREGIAWRVRISLPSEIAGCVARKGSIAVDGVSLTVIAAEGGSFEVGIIPHTMSETTLHDVKPGVRVNLEADVLARYVLRTLQAMREGREAITLPGESVTAGGLTETLLREQGFV